MSETIKTPEIERFDPNVPIPNFSGLRRRKDSYDTRSNIDKTHPLANDPLVDLRDDGYVLMML